MCCLLVETTNSRQVLSSRSFLQFYRPNRSTIARKFMPKNFGSCNNKTQPKVMQRATRLPTENKNICPTLLAMFMFMHRGQFFGFTHMLSKLLFWSLTKKSESKHAKNFPCMLCCALFFASNSWWEILCLAFPSAKKIRKTFSCILATRSCIHLCFSCLAFLSMKQQPYTTCSI